MNGKEAIKAALTSTQTLLGMYVSDLSDAELLERPVPGANHIAWQLGHLIGADVFLVKEQLPDAVFPELPAGFAQKYTKETAGKNSPGDFATKGEYLDLFNKVRSAVVAALDKLSDADLDRPTQGRMAPFAPRLGDLFLLVSNHTLMHAGQFTVLRRKLGQPVLF
jgi:uncharacterized damage-inducible protein DinB